MDTTVRQATWSVYILHSQTLDRTYIGCAHDVEARLAQHNARRVRATRAGAPWQLIGKESIGDYTAALQRERYYKSGAGRRKLAVLFNTLLPGKGDCPPASP